MNLDLPEPVKEQLEVLRDETHADSMSEVVRRALAVYDLLVSEQANGAKMVLKSQDGTERQLEFI